MDLCSSYAPVALFVYNRLKNTRKTVEALKKNKYADQTELYVFSDGGRDERSWKEVNVVRRYLKTITGFKRVHIIERPVNYYLEKNLIEGINAVLAEHGRIIVLEDDIVTSPFFLEFMNTALELYKDEQALMHISGFNFFDIPQKKDVVFSHFMACWGWATWADRWQYFRHFTSREDALRELSPAEQEKIQYGGNFTCLKTLDYNPIPWDVCWYIAIYKQSKYCLIPTETLVRNIGIYAGTHARVGRLFGSYVFDRPATSRRLTCEYLPPREDAEVECMFREYFQKKSMRYNLLGKVVRFFYLKLIKRN